MPAAAAACVPTLLLQVAGLVGQQAAIQPGEKNSGAQGLKERPAPVAVVDPGAGAKLANKAVGGKRSAEQVRHRCLGTSSGLERQ